MKMTNLSPASPMRTTKIFFNRLNDNKGFALSVAFVFMLFFLIEMVTPFHSDDFHYAQLQGLQPHIKHYLGWSGRVVADFSSSILLTFPHFVVSVVLAAVATALCWLITAIPDRVFNCTSSPWKFLLISSLFWVFNPNLGQTTFWVVGACNYLVTTFFVGVVIYLAIRFKDGLPNWAVPIVALVAICAGCSNENTTLALIYVLISLTAWEYYGKTSFSHKTRILILVCVLVGAAVLLLAPGNFARLNHPAFAEWRSLTLFEQVVKHVHRSEKYLKFFWFVLLMLVINCAAVKKFAPSEEAKHRLIGALIFFSASLGALVVMAKSPAMPPRSFSGMFFFLLLALSFVSDERLFKNSAVQCQKALIVTLTFIMGLSFSLMLTNYNATKIQEELRNAHINYEKLLNGQAASPTIPGYFFTDLLRAQERFDMFHSGSQASWFQVKKVNLQPVRFDYSVIRTGRSIEVVNKSSLKTAKVYVKAGIASLRKSTIIVECEGQPSVTSIVIKFYRTRDKKPSTFTLSDPIVLSGKSYFGLTRRIKYFDQIQSIVIQDKP